MTQSQQVWFTVIGLALTALASVLAARITSKSTAQAAKTTADEGAFIRAKEIFEAGIDEQGERIDRIAADLADTRAQLGETVRELGDTRADLRAARDEIKILRQSVSQYEGRVIQLTEVLRLHDIDVPPWTLNPSDYGMLPGSIPDPNQPPRITLEDDEGGT